MGAEAGHLSHLMLKPTAASKSRPLAAVDRNHDLGKRTTSRSKVTRHQIVVQ
jgi:hypothetical protein